MENIKIKFEKFMKAVKENDLNVLEALVWENGTVTEFSVDGKNHLREVYSISKIITGLAVMKAIELGLFTTETPVMKFFEDIKIYNKKNLPFLQDLKIKHLLTLTLGQEENRLMFEQWILDNLEITEKFVSCVLNFPLKNKAGEVFLYANSCNYLVSAIIQRITGKNLSEFANEYIFKSLGIVEWSWKNCKDEICLGATGLSLKLHDILKIGQLLLQNGKFEGKQIIKSELVKGMKKQRVSAEMIRTTHPYVSPVFPKNGYGLNVWLTGDGNYFADGKKGQFLIIMPKEKRIIITLSSTTNSSEMRQIVNCMDVFKCVTGK